MRLDKFLKVSRLIKRRTVANEACDNGLISVNGKPQRASYEVKEGDKSLAVERVTVKDPLHLIAYNAKTPTGGFGTTNTKHMFRVKASSASSTLEIKVTDRFNNVYTESMKRPKAFTMDTYK